MKLWIMKATWGGIQLWWNNGTYTFWYVMRMIEKYAYDMRMIEKHTYDMMWGMWGIVRNVKKECVCGD